MGILLFSNSCDLGDAGLFGDDGLAPARCGCGGQVRCSQPGVSGCERRFGIMACQGCGSGALLPGLSLPHGITGNKVRGFGFTVLCSQRLFRRGTLVCCFLRRDPGILTLHGIGLRRYFGEQPCSGGGTRRLVGQCSCVCLLCGQVFRSSALKGRFALQGGRGGKCFCSRLGKGFGLQFLFCCRYRGSCDLQPGIDRFCKIEFDTGLFFCSSCQLCFPCRTFFCGFGSEAFRLFALGQCRGNSRNLPGVFLFGPCREFILLCMRRKLFPRFMLGISAFNSGRVALSLGTDAHFGSDTGLLFCGDTV